MSKVTHVVGVDPGLVHSGCVRLVFSQPDNTMEIQTKVVDGPDAEAITDWTFALGLPRPRVYVERYRPRQALNTDVRMVQAERDIMKAIPSAVTLLNTGVKQVVSEPVLRALKLWTFKDVTHHQDLRSAARIAVLGIMKNDTMNVVLADYIRAHLHGDPWQVIEP